MEKLPRLIQTLRLQHSAAFVSTWAPTILPEETWNIPRLTTQLWAEHQEQGSSGALLDSAGEKEGFEEK